MRLVLLCLMILTGLVCLANADDSWMLYDDSRVAVIHVEIDPAALQWILANPQSDSLHLARCRFENACIDEWVEDIGFRLRGNTSRDSQKKSFKISFNTFVSGREFYDVDKLNLNGEHNDPSIIRSKLCWDFYQKIGMTASRACHAALYMNDEYYGLYVSVEHYDDEFLDNHYSDPSGNLWKCLWPADLTYKGESPSSYHPYAGDTRPYELTTNEEQYDYSQLARLIRIINKTSTQAFAESLEAVLCVPEVLKYFAADVLLGSWDDYWSLMNNYYLYYEPGLNRFHWIPYDYDNTFGIDWSGIEWAQADPYDFPLYNSGSRPLATRLMANQSYRNLYTHFLEFYNDCVFQWSLWESDVYALRDMIAPWAQMDDYRTRDYGFDDDGGLEDFLNSYDLANYSDRHVTQSIKTFVINRNASLSGQLSYTPMLPMIYDVSYSPSEPGPGDSITICASVFDHEGLALVQLSLDYEDQSPFFFPMVFSPVPGTQRVEETDRYMGTIAAAAAGKEVSFYVDAFDNSGHNSVYPRSGSITIRSTVFNIRNLKLNEFMADNDNGIHDETGDNDDWFELYNAGDVDVNLGGMYLTDNLTDPDKWQVPDTSIAARGFLLFWADEEEEEGPLHTNFKLSKGGEELGLFDDDGVTLIDSVTFGEQETDVSYGRSPDGADVWHLFEQSTPGEKNVLWVRGDANGDGLTNVLDALAAVNCILGLQCRTEEERYRADCNGDGTINILDVLGIVNVILGIGECGELEF